MRIIALQISSLVFSLLLIGCSLNKVHKTKFLDGFRPGMISEIDNFFIDIPSLDYCFDNNKSLLKKTMVEAIDACLHHIFKNQPEILEKDVAIDLAFEVGACMKNAYAYINKNSLKDVDDFELTHEQAIQRQKCFVVSKDLSLAIEQNRIPPELIK